MLNAVEARVFAELPPVGQRSYPLDQSYPAQVYETHAAHGFRDFGGVEDEDLLAHYEKATGKKYEPRAVHVSLPPPLGFCAVMRLFSRPRKEPAYKKGGGWKPSGNATAAARAWTGSGTEQEAAAIGAKWLCPSCGPVGEPLHGDDERMHCPELECDQVVDPVLARWLTQDELKKQSQRRMEMAYPVIECSDCDKEFKRTGMGQGRRTQCYKCRPKGTANTRDKKTKPKASPAKPRKAKAKKQTCRGCGCHDADPCTPEGKDHCDWIEDNLCSECVTSPEQETETPEPSSTLMLKTEAEALVRVAEALEGLAPSQIERVLGWVREAVL